MPEIRRNKRITLDGQVAIKTPVPGDRLRLMRAYLDDISLGGARLYAEEEIDVDQPLKMRVRIPWSGRVVQGTGRVRHTTKVRRAGQPRFAMGIEFMDMDRGKIQNLINDKISGGPHRFAPLRQRRREIRLILKLTPVLIIGTWLLMNSAFNAQSSLREDQRFFGELRKAAIHFLYNSE